MTVRAPFLPRRPLRSAVLCAALALCACRADVSSTSSWSSHTGTFYSTELQHGVPHMQLSIRETASELWVDATGPIQFSDDDRDFVLAGPTSKVAVRERAAGGDRSYSRTTSGDERYVVDGQTRTFDDGGREWLSQCVATVIESTPFGAEQRAERLLRAGGVAAVTRELGRVRSASARSIYLQAAIQSGALDAQGVAEAVRASTTAELGESTRVELCLVAAPLAVADRDLTSALIDAAAPLSSSSNRARLLEAVLEQRSLDAATGQQLVTAAGQISSVSTRTDVLVRALDALPNDGALRASWIRALGAESSSNLQRALSALLARDDVTTADLRGIAASAPSISSSSSRADLLRALARHPRADLDVLREVHLANRATSTSSDSASVLLALLDRPELDRADIENIAESTKDVASSSERERVQQRIIQRLLETSER